MGSEIALQQAQLLLILVIGAVLQKMAELGQLIQITMQKALCRRDSANLLKLMLKGLRAIFYRLFHAVQSGQLHLVEIQILQQPPRKRSLLNLGITADFVNKAIQNTR